MKKKYQQPLIKVLCVENEPLLNASVVTYGGETVNTMGSTPLLAVRQMETALCGAMLSLITPGQLGIKVYCKQNAGLKNSLNPAFYFFLLLNLNR